MRKPNRHEIVAEALEQQTTAEAQLAEAQSRRPAVQSIVETLNHRRKQNGFGYQADGSFMPRFIGQRGN